MVFLHLSRTALVGAFKGCFAALIAKLLHGLINSITRSGSSG